MIRTSPENELNPKKHNPSNLIETLNPKMRLPLHQPSIPGKFMTLFVESQTQVGFGIGSSRKLAAFDYKSSENLLENKEGSLHQKELLYQKFINDRVLKFTKMAQTKSEPPRYILIPKICHHKNKPLSLPRNPNIIHSLAVHQHKTLLNKHAFENLYQEQLTRKLNAETLTGPGCYQPNDQLVSKKIQDVNFVFKSQGRLQETRVRKTESLNQFPKNLKFDFVNSPFQNLQPDKKKLDKNKIGNLQIDKENIKNNGNQVYVAAAFIRKNSLPKVQTKYLELGKFIRDLKKVPIHNEFFDETCQKFKLSFLRKTTENGKGKIIFGKTQAELVSRFVNSKSLVRFNEPEIEGDEFGEDSVKRETTTNSGLLNKNESKLFRETDQGFFLSNDPNFKLQNCQVRTTPTKILANFF